MTSWKTVTELSEDYLVGSDRLLGFARRGNLACRWLEDGTTLFDEAGVALLFRTRHGNESLGTLGLARLGDGTPSAAPATSRRHRARPQAEPSFPAVAPSLRRVG